MTSTACSPESFSSLSWPSINILSLYASIVTDFPIESELQIPNHGYYSPGTVDFCNVTIVYTHPEEEDYPINFEAWLPDHKSWNERLIASGGSGFAAGRFSDTYKFMSGLIDEGYASFTTDGGTPNVTNFEFALKETGVIDEIRLRNWATVAIGDMATIGKAVVDKYYDQPAKYSYFSGCSQGGRQGYDFAQRYPDAFDGIAAAAPAISFLEAAYNIFWPQFLMNQGESWPVGCELDSLTALAIKTCDGRDGVEDGLISDPALCEDFDPFDHVGETAVACADTDSTISETAAYIANATWTGLTDLDGHVLYPGLLPGSDFTGNSSGIGIATTTCYDTDDGDCKGLAIELGYALARVFSEKNSEFDYTQITLESLYKGLEEARQEYGDDVQAMDPDLSAFKERGGKLITYHGLADQLLTTGIVRQYYNQATKFTPDIHDFFRYFEIPGLGHCVGPQHPHSTFNSLKLWVEKGIVPETLAYQQPDADGREGERIACAYPKKAVYDKCCGDSYKAECFKCR